MRMELTRRLKRIHKRLFDEEFVTKKAWHFDGDTILVNDEILKEPLVVRKAKAMEYVATNLPAYVKKDELIGLPAAAPYPQRVPETLGIQLDAKTVTWGEEQSHGLSHV